MGIKFPKRIRDVYVPPEDIPSGYYLATVQEEYEYNTQKNYVLIVMTILEQNIFAPDVKGSRILDYISLNEKALWRAKMFLCAVYGIDGDKLDIEEFPAPEEIIGKPFVIEFTKVDGSYRGKITRYFKSEKWQQLKSKKYEKVIYQPSYPYQSSYQKPQNYPNTNINSHSYNSYNTTTNNVIADVVADVDDDDDIPF